MTPPKGYIPQALPEAALNYHVRERGLAAQRPRRRLWQAGPILNQQNDPACVGFAWAGELIARPAADLNVSRKVADEYGRNHWRRSQVKWFGETRADEGSTILKGAEVARDRGLIDEFQWASSIEEIRDALISVGPVVLGIPWFNSMLNVSRKGRIKVRAGDARDAEYHAVILNGYDPAINLGGRRKVAAFRIRNSWGTMWGKTDPKDWRRGTGEGWVTHDDLEAILDAHARLYPDKWSDTACLPVGRNPVDLAALLAAHPDPHVS